MTAFAGTTGEFTVGTTAEDVYTSVTLTHAVAMVNFVQTEALTSAANTLTVKYPKSYSLNVADGAVTEIAGEVTHTLHIATRLPEHWAQATSLQPPLRTHSPQRPCSILSYDERRNTENH